MQQKDQKNQKKISNNLVEYARYSSLAFQMAFILLAGVFGGIKLDKLVKLEFPLFTILLSFFAVVFATYYGIKDLLRKNK